MLHILSYGRDSKPHIVFFHGFLGTGDDFLPIIERLQNDFLCTVLDLPGHGKSPCSLRPVKTIEHTLRTMDKPIDAFVGYSMGGRIALLLSQHFSIKKLVLLSAHPGLTFQEKKGQRAKEDYWLNAIETLQTKDFVDLWYSQPLFSSLTTKGKLFTTMLKKRQQQDRQGIYNMYRALRLSRQVRVDAMPAPTVFAYGELDGKYQDLYEDWKTVAAIEKIEGAGHAVHIENPLRCAEIIDTFLQRENPNDNRLATSCRL